MTELFIWVMGLGSGYLLGSGLWYRALSNRIREIRADPTVTLPQLEGIAHFLSKWA